jgi:hypothetical protein
MIKIYKKNSLLVEKFFGFAEKSEKFLKKFFPTKIAKGKKKLFKF